MTLCDAAAPQPIFQILGDDLAAWTVAAVLARDVAGVATVRIAPGRDISADARGAAAEAFATAIVDTESIWLTQGEQDAARLLIEGGGGFWLGTRFVGWGPQARDAMHAPSEALPVRGGVAHHQLLRRFIAADGNAPQFAALYEQLLFQARLAAAGKFAPSSDDRASPRSLLRPAIALDAAALTAVMRGSALAAGVEIVGEAVAADETLLTIDCRADDAADTPGDWIDESDRFGANRMLTARAVSRDSGSHAPYDSVIALDRGLLHLVPLRDAIVARLCYRGEELDDSAASEALAAALPQHQLDGQRHGRWRAGRLPAPWRGNSVRLGPAAASLGSVAGVDMQLLSGQIARLMTLLPDGGGADLPSKASAYNAAIAALFDHWLDFMQLPMVRNGLAGPRWAALRDQPLSAALARRLDLFERRGHAVMLDYDIFENNVWIALFIALGVMPRRHDRVVEAVNLPAQMKEMGKMVMAFDSTIRAMPAHKDFLAKMIEEAGVR